VQNRRRVVYYAILLLLILGELLGERNYIIIIFPEYDRVRENKIRLGLVDVNLQTEKLHCNYSVLIGSPE